MILTAIMGAIPNRFKDKMTEDSKSAIFAVVKAIRDSGNQVDRLCGVGGRIITLGCTDGAGSPFAAKIDSRSVPQLQLEDSPLYRQVANTVLLKNPDFIAKPFPIFKFKRKSPCFFGTTIPNSKGECHLFYICEHLDCLKAKDFISSHSSAWRDTGILTEEFRLRVLVPLVGAIHSLNSMGLFILDVKPENLGFDSNGRFKISDLGFSAVQRNHSLGFPQEAPVATLSARFLNPPISMGGPGG
jgi:serine/threonine protein kinase